MHVVIARSHYKIYIKDSDGAFKILSKWVFSMFLVCLPEVSFENIEYVYSTVLYRICVCVSFCIYLGCRDRCVAVLSASRSS